MIKIREGYVSNLRKYIVMNFDPSAFVFEVRLPDGHTIKNRDGKQAWEEATKMAEDMSVDRWVDIIEITPSRYDRHTLMLHSTRKHVGYVNTGVFVEREWQGEGSCGRTKGAPFAHASSISVTPQAAVDAFVAGEFPIRHGKYEGKLWLVYDEGTWELLNKLQEQVLSLNTVIQSVLELDSRHHLEELSQRLDALRQFGAPTPE